MHAAAVCRGLHMTTLTTYETFVPGILQNTATYYVIDLSAREAFEASAFWTKMYVAEAGLPSNGIDSDPAGAYELGTHVILVVPTFRHSIKPMALPLDFDLLARQLEFLDDTRALTQP